MRPGLEPRRCQRARAIRILCGALGILAVHGPAGADTVEDRFAVAANLIAAGRESEAAAQLESLAREAPDHALAPEALFSAAELYEERLTDPARALALYRELERRYPDSRRALAASRRAGMLAAQVGPGAEGLEAQRRFLAIRQGFAERPEAESIAMAEALVREHPDWVGAPAVALWLAGADERAGRHEAALRRYLAAADRYNEPEARFDALRGAGDVALQLGRYDEAERTYRLLDARGDPARRIAIDELLAAVSRERVRSRWCWTSAALAGAGFLALGMSLLRAAGAARAALRALWPPPGEVLYLGPIGLFLSAVSYTAYQGLGPAVTLVSAGGLLVAWVSGAGLSLRLDSAARPGFALAHALIAGIAMLAMVYIATYTTGLLDPVLDTLRYGPTSFRQPAAADKATCGRDLGPVYSARAPIPPPFRSRARDSIRAQSEFLEPRRGRHVPALRGGRALHHHAGDISPPAASPAGRDPCGARGGAKEPGRLSPRFAAGCASSASAR